MSMIEMKYVGPGVAPPNIKVDEAEVADLAKTGLWKKAAKSEDKKEEVKDG